MLASRTGIGQEQLEGKNVCTYFYISILIQRIHIQSLYLNATREGEAKGVPMEHNILAKYVSMLMN